MRLYWWIFIGILGILVGILLVFFMTVQPIQMSLYLLLALGSHQKLQLRDIGAFEIRY